MLSEGQRLKAQRLRGDGMSWCELARTLNIPEKSLRASIDPDYAQNLRAQRYRARQRIMAKVADERRTFIRRAQIETYPRIEPPAAVIAERDRAEAAAELRDLTALICGDPPKGRSALDRRVTNTAAQ